MSLQTRNDCHARTSTEQKPELGINFGKPRHAAPSDPSRNDSGFTRLTALFDKIGIDPLGGDNIRIAASPVSV
jgi:hypothetical protein